MKNDKKIVCVYYKYNILTMHDIVLIKQSSVKVSLESICTMKQTF